MKHTALLIIDVQEGLMEDHPTQEKKFLKNIKELLTMSRIHGLEVIFVRHHDEDDLIMDTPRWEIYHEIASLRHELVMDKHKNSAFFETKLKLCLDNSNIHNLIIVGMQTEHCVDATCKSAFEKGYHVYIPKDCVTTFDNPHLSGEKCNQYYYEHIWKGRYATICSLEEIINMISNKKEN